MVAEGGCIIEKQCPAYMEVITDVVDQIAVKSRVAGIMSSIQLRQVAEIT